MLQLQSVIGVLVLPALALALSENRRGLQPRQLVRWIVIGLAVQYGLAIVLTQMPGSQVAFRLLGQGVEALQRAVDAGSMLMFGYLAGGPAPFEITRPGNDFVVAVRVLPMILVLSAIVRLLYHWGVLQRIVGGLAYALGRSMGIGGPLATVSASSVFLGLVEAPLVVKPYIRDMGRGALFAMIACTMATVAGTVMALYASILANVVPGAAGHLLVASLMNVPAALLLARIVVPDGFEGGPAAADVHFDGEASSAIDAISRGTSDGIQLVAGVAAMLIVAVSLVALTNSILAAVGAPLGLDLTLQKLLGFAFAPIALLIGIPAGEALTAGGLLGIKVVLNEFLAFIELVKTAPGELSERSRLLLTYALCGFANLGSLGITVAGLGTMAPERRADIVELAPKAVVVGMMATLMTAAIMGSITPG